MSSNPPNPMRRALPLVVFLFLTVFLATISLRDLALSAWRTFQTFGLYSPTNEFYLYLYLLFALLPFGFNFAFGAYFALVFYKSSDQPPPAAGPWFAPLLFALWLILFNLPVLLGGYTTSGHGLEWPPRGFYTPVYMELVLFMPMGNLGALLGFAAGGLAVHARHHMHGPQ